MNYEEFLVKLRHLFLAILNKKVTEEEYLKNPRLMAFAVRDKIYTNIMALGYNFGDKQKAIDDIYEMQVPLFGESNELYQEIRTRVVDTGKKYPDEIIFFSNTHRDYLHHKPLENILNELEINLK